MNEKPPLQISLSPPNAYRVKVSFDASGAAKMRVTTETRRDLPTEARHPSQPVVIAELLPRSEER